VVGTVHHCLCYRTYRGVAGRADASDVHPFVAVYVARTNHVLSPYILTAFCCGGFTSGPTVVEGLEPRTIGRLERLSVPHNIALVSKQGTSFSSNLLALGAALYGWPAAYMAQACSMDEPSRRAYACRYLSNLTLPEQTASPMDRLCAPSPHASIATCLARFISNYWRRAPRVALRIAVIAQAWRGRRWRWRQRRAGGWLRGKRARPHLMPLVSPPTNIFLNRAALHALGRQPSSAVTWKETPPACLLPPRKEGRRGRKDRQLTWRPRSSRTQRHSPALRHYDTHTLLLHRYHYRALPRRTAHLLPLGLSLLAMLRLLPPQACA